jgi:shikimate dehydrogenase
VVGHNTDIVGFKTSIKRSEYNLNNKKVLILGAGGVVPSIIFSLIKMKPSKITICNRTKEKSTEFKKNF